MSEHRKPTKRHLERLRGEVRDLEGRERRQQERFGDRVKGSVRSRDFRLAEALRAVLAYVDGVQVVSPAMPLIRQDEEYRRAVAIVLHDGRACVATVQRKLAIGWTQAKEFVARMIRDGIVAAEDAPAAITGVREDGK